MYTHPYTAGRNNTFLGRSSGFEKQHVAANDEPLYEPMELHEHESTKAKHNSSLPSAGNGLGPKLKLRKTQKGGDLGGKRQISQ